MVPRAVVIRAALTLTCLDDQVSLDVADIARAIEAGATGYLLQGERPEELFAAIRTAATGRTALSAPVADRVLAQLRSPRPRRVTRSWHKCGVTPPLVARLRP